MTWKDAFEVLGGVVIGLILSYWRGLVGKYGEKSGELLAIERNLDLVLNEQKKTTEITEQIKTDLADKSSAKQRREEMKRDTALEIMRLFGTLQEAALAIHSAIFILNRLPYDKTVSEERKKKVKDDFDAASKQFQAAMTKLWQTQQEARLVFPIVVYEKMEAVRLAVHSFWGGIYSDDSKFEPLMNEINEREKEVINTLKAELQI